MSGIYQPTNDFYSKVIEYKAFDERVFISMRILPDKGRISREEALRKAEAAYDEFNRT